MALIQVTISELENAAAKISRANENFRTAATNLKAAADALAQTWEGPSQEAFADEHVQIDNWYKQMADVVDQYVGTMQVAAQKYNETDENAAARIRNS